MHGALHHNFHYSYALFPKKLRFLFIAQLLRGGALQIIGLFIPIYVYIVFSQQDILQTVPRLSPLSTVQRGMLGVAGFYILLRLTSLVCLPILVKIIQRIGLTRAMALGNIMIALALASLSAAGTRPIFLLPAAALFGIEIVLYWVSYLTGFTLLADSKRMGAQVGALEFLNRFGFAFLPLIGGLIVVIGGFTALHGLGVVVLLSTSLFLIGVPQISCDYTVKLSEIFSWLKEHKLQRASLGFVGRQIDDLAFSVWIIYLFLFIGAVEKVGAFFTGVLLISLLVSYFVGWYLGKHRGRKMLLLSGGVLSILWGLRAFVGQFWHIVVVDSLEKVMKTVYVPIFDSLYLRLFKGQYVFRYHVYREMINSVTGIVFWSILAVVFLFPIQWTAVFFLASVGVILSLLITGEAHG